jgi:hypothetical protein
VLVPRDGVWSGNQIHCTLTNRNYNILQCYHNSHSLQFTLAHAKSLCLHQSLLENGSECHLLQVNILTDQWSSHNSAPCGHCVPAMSDLHCLSLLMLRPTVSRPVCFGVRHPFRARYQILIFSFLPDNCLVLHMGFPLLQEDKSVICSAVTLWSELCKTHNYILPSHFRLPQPGGPGPIFIFPRNRVDQLYSQALGSLSVASNSSWGYGGGILTRFHTGYVMYFCAIFKKV